MKVLSPRAHGYLDYITVAAFGAAPTLFSLQGIPRLVAYALAAVHLVLTLLTDFRLGVARIVAFWIHGLLELVVAVGLMAFPWFPGLSTDPGDRVFLVVAGIVILGVWLLTRYGGTSGEPDSEQKAAHP
jgi:hypothetical protein